MGGRVVGLGEGGRGGGWFDKLAEDEVFLRQLVVINYTNIKTYKNIYNNNNREN